MDYVGVKVVRKDFGGRTACFGTVVAFSTVTGLFKVAFYGVNESEETQLTELYPLLLTPPPRGEGSSGGVGAGLENPHESGRNFDLNVSGDIDLNIDVGGGLHGLDLNEGVNYILNGEIDSTPKSRENNLNLDLNEQASAMEIDDRGKAATEDEDCVIIGGSRWRRNYRTNPDAESRRLSAMPSFPARDYQLYVANIHLMQFQAPAPPKAYLLASSIGGAEQSRSRKSS